MPELSRSEDPTHFEEEVIRIARLLYPGDPSGGATIQAGRERDGVLITEDMVVLIEATTSRAKEKAEKDGKKLKELAESYAKRFPYKGIKGFFVTLNEPTADQRDVIRKLGSPLAAISYAKFKALLLDAKSYLEYRMDHAFGSARDPETDAIKVTDDYIEIGFIDHDIKRELDAETVTEKIAKGERIVLVGDYGTGKSMTLREVFLRLRKQYYRDNTIKPALHLSLIDHQGQTDPAEALIRHATLLGFPSPNQLVRAWRSGEVHLILDGFDEVFGAIGGDRPIAEIRKLNVQLIRSFAEQTPIEVGILIAGREHYFDSVTQLRDFLGLDDKATIANSTDYTESQMKAYLTKRNWEKEPPQWLPRRPLLVGYLAGRKLFSAVDEVGSVHAGEGWHRLIDAICKRDANVDKGLDSQAVRRMLERLATIARRTPTGLGPLEFSDLVRVFQDLRNNRLPNAGEYLVLERLPGLRVTDGQANTRSFVDDDLVDAVRAGDVYTWIAEPYQGSDPQAFEGAQNLLGYTGLAVLQHRIDLAKLSAGILTSALTRAVNQPSSLQADLVRILMLLGITPISDIQIEGHHVPSLDLAASCDGRRVSFSDCIIDVLDLSDVDRLDGLPHFSRCSIGKIEGITGLDELAGERFNNCDIALFSDSAKNMSSILRLDLSDRRRVALTLLRKIFVQSGHSRKENALYRGSLNPKQKELIPDILEQLRALDVIRMVRMKGNTFWEPNRALHSRVARILDNPTTSDDELLLRF